MKTRHRGHSGFSIPLYTLCPLWFRFPVQLHPMDYSQTTLQAPGQHADDYLADLPILLQVFPTAISSFDARVEGEYLFRR
jgi:hypothetical protein